MEEGWNQYCYNCDAIFFQYLIHVFHNIVIIFLNAAFKLSLCYKYFFHILKSYSKHIFNGGLIFH